MNSEDLDSIEIYLSEVLTAEIPMLQRWQRQRICKLVRERLEEDLEEED